MKFAVTYVSSLQHSQFSRHATLLRASTRPIKLIDAPIRLTVQLARGGRVHFVTRPVTSASARRPESQAVSAKTPVGRPVTYKCPANATTVSNDASVLERPCIVRVADWLRTQRELEATGRKKKPRGRLVARQRRETAFRNLTRGWRRLSSEERQARENDFILRSEGIAWSLNFDEQTEGLIRKDKRPANCLANKIQRLAKTMTGAKVPIVLVLEETEEGRLHAHGVAILENWNKDTLTAFMDLLRRAGGRIGGARQVALRKLFSATGWRDYITKVMPRTIANLGSHCVTYTSREITSLAREDYTRELERQKTVRRRRAAARGRAAASPVVPALSEAASANAPRCGHRAIFLSRNAGNDIPVAVRAGEGRSAGHRQRHPRRAERGVWLSSPRQVRGDSVQAHDVGRRKALVGFQTRHHSLAARGIADCRLQPALFLALEIGEGNTAPLIDTGKATSKRRSRGGIWPAGQVAARQIDILIKRRLRIDRGQRHRRRIALRRTEKPAGERDAVGIGTSSARLQETVRPSLDLRIQVEGECLALPCHSQATLGALTGARHPNRRDVVSEKIEAGVDRNPVGTLREFLKWRKFSLRCLLAGPRSRIPARRRD